MEAALKSIESSGGYAILTLVVLLGVFYIARDWQRAMARRAVEREAAARADFEAQLERERMNRETIQGMTDRVIVALDGNTRVIATVIEVTRETNGRLEAIDKHLSRNARDEGGGR